MIPKILHFIWLGSSLPKEYQQNILSFKTHNPSFKIFLWIDYQSLSPEDTKAMTDFCLAENIELQDIREKTLLNHDLIIEELDKAQKDAKKMARIHWVRVSDLARIGALFKYGGIYNDTDNQCKQAMPDNMAMRYGFLSIYIEKAKTFAYHFMAATPQNPIMELSAAISRVDYATYHKSTNRNWEQSNRYLSLLYGNVKLTGTALKWALNYLLHTAKIKNLNELFLDTSSFLDSSFDKSWLKDFQEEDLADDPSVYEFCDEITQNRQKIYPLAEPKSAQQQLETQQMLNTLKMDNSLRLIPHPKFNINPTLRNQPTSLTCAELPLPKIELPLPKIEFALPTVDLSKISENINNLLNLKLVITQVSEEYCKYSLTHCKYSIFHQHHKSGRDRVDDWLKKIQSIDALSDLQKEILDYLSNNNNGRTHPHSFRMMLVKKLSNQSNTPKTTSFDELFEQLKGNYLGTQAQSKPR